MRFEIEGKEKTEEVIKWSLDIDKDGDVEIYANGKVVMWIHTSGQVVAAADMDGETVSLTYLGLIDYVRGRAR